MTDIVVAQRMWQRRDTAAAWTAANPILAAGEIGVELPASGTQCPFKIGDGVTHWGGLPYAGFTWGGLTGKTTPVNADAFALMDSADGNATKLLTWANLRAYLDTLYAAFGGGGGGGATTEGTWASRPATPSGGALHFCTDSPSMARYDGSAWQHRIGTIPVTPPILANFSQVNFGTTTTAAFGPFTSIIPQVGTAYNLRVLDMAAPATPYTIEFGFLIPQFIYNGAGVGPLFGGGFRKASTGAMHLSWYDGDNATNFRGIKMNSATSANSTYFSVGMNPGPTNLVKMRVRDDGVNRYVDAQQGDGSWRPVSSIVRTDFLTPDRVCIAVNIQQATYMDRIHWVHWKQY